MEPCPGSDSRSADRQPHGGTILLVDDDEDFRRGFAENLRDDGYGVSEFSDPSELPSLANLSDVKLVITDYDMARQNGLSFADAFHKAHPEVPIVLVTAYPAPGVSDLVERRGYLRWRSKPIDYDEFSNLIQGLVLDR